MDVAFLLTSMSYTNLLANNLTIVFLRTDKVREFNPTDDPDTSNWNAARSPRKSSIVTPDRRESRRLELTRISPEIPVNPTMSDETVE